MKAEQRSCPKFREPFGPLCNNQVPSLVTNLNPLPLFLVSCAIFSGQILAYKKESKEQVREGSAWSSSSSGFVPHSGPFLAPGPKACHSLMSIRMLKIHCASVFSRLVPMLIFLK